MDNALYDDGVVFIHCLGEEEENLRRRTLLFLDTAGFERTLVFDIFRSEKFMVWVCVCCSKRAAWLLVPYLLWVSFASILNLAVAMLN